MAVVLIATVVAVSGRRLRSPPPRIWQAWQRWCWRSSARTYSKELHPQTFVAYASELSLPALSADRHPTYFSDLNCL